MGNKLIILPLIILLLFAGTIHADGVCHLDKEIYFEGETALLSCSCTNKNEKNAAGYFVWQNDSDILQSVATNSGDCINNFFTSSYTFDSQNYTGNATFSLDADGTGTPINWDNGGDIISDDFNLTSGSITNCIILFEDANNITYDVGRLGAIALTIKDSIINYSLTHANCQIHLLDINGNHILQEPYETGDSSISSGALGHIMFQHILDEPFWDLNTTYLMEGTCHCTEDDKCFLGNNGSDAGFKQCITTFPFKTGTIDYREVITDEGNYMLATILASIMFAIFFIGLGIITNSPGRLSNSVRWASMIIGYLEIFLIAGLVYGYSLGKDMSPLLYINLIVIGLIGFGLLMITLYLKSMEMMIIDDTKTKHEKKW